LLRSAILEQRIDVLLQDRTQMVGDVEDEGWGVKAFMEKMVQITSFASKAEGSGVSVLCVYFHGESTCLQLHLPVSAH